MGENLWARRNQGGKAVREVVGKTPRRPHVQPDAGPHRTRIFRKFRAPNWAGRNVRVSPPCGPPGGHGITYGGGVPRSGGAPPCPP